MAGENPPQEMRAAVLELLMMRAMQAEVVTAAVTAAMTAAVPSAGGRFADRRDGCDRGHDQCRRDAKTTRWPPRWYRVNVMDWMCHGTAVGDGVETERPARANTTGRAFISICLHVGGVADVDVPMEPRAPHPAGRVSAVVEVAVAVAVVAVVAVMAVVAMVAVMAVMTVMTVMAMTATVPAAGGRVSGRRKRGDGQRDSGDSGGEDGTLHRTSPGFVPERPSPWVMPISALRRSPKM